MTKLLPLISCHKEVRVSFAWTSISMMNVYLQNNPVNFLWNVKTKQAVSWPGTYHINKSMFYLCVRLSCNRTIFCGSKAIISNKYTLWILIFFFPGDKDFMLTSCYHHHLVWELLTHDQQCSFPETWPSLRCCGESHRRVWEDGGRKNVCSAWGW